MPTASRSRNKGSTNNRISVADLLGKGRFPTKVNIYARAYWQSTISVAWVAALDQSVVGVTVTGIWPNLVHGHLGLPLTTLYMKHAIMLWRKVTARPSIRRPKGSATSCNVTAATPTSRWNMRISWRHHSTSVVTETWSISTFTRRETP